MRRQCTGTQADHRSYGMLDFAALVGERSISLRRRAARRAGGIGNEYAGMSSDK